MIDTALIGAMPMPTETPPIVPHTPGPWEVDGEDRFARVLAPSGWTIAETPHVPNGDPDTWDEVTLANMRVIAAAPSLLASCDSLLKLLAESIAHGMPVRQDVADARNHAVAAIRKATVGA